MTTITYAIQYKRKCVTDGSRKEILLTANEWHTPEQARAEFIKNWMAVEGRRARGLSFVGPVTFTRLVRITKTVEVVP
jgi:hypothetical protein